MSLCRRRGPVLCNEAAGDPMSLLPCLTVGPPKMKEATDEGLVHRAKPVLTNGDGKGDLMARWTVLFRIHRLACE